MDVELKKCPKSIRFCAHCKEDHPMTKSFWTKAGKYFQCKIYYRMYREKNKERIASATREYYKRNEEKIVAYQKSYKISNYETINSNKKVYMKLWNASHRDQLRDWQRRDKLNNPDKYRVRARNYLTSHKAHISNYVRTRMKYDVEFKLRVTLRNRLRAAMKEEYKRGQIIKNLGCSIVELKQHLERQFVSGMTWDNHGLHGWHIDHIIPLSAMELSNPEEAAKVLHYTNLQPLWAIDNLRKSNKII